jgi:MFS family permease
MSQLKPRFSDVGFSDMTAMLMMSATALVGAAGKYIWGILCDRFDPRKVTAVLISLLVLGLISALLPVHPLSIVLFILVFGFSMGGVMSTLPIIVADLFGRESFPAVFRLISLILVLELAGFVIAGQSYDRTGSYNMAYVIFIVFDMAAFFLILSVKRPESITGNAVNQ